MRIKIGLFFLIGVLSFFSVLKADEPVGVIRVQNTTEFLRKCNQFLSQGNSSLDQFSMVLHAADWLSPSVSALDFKKPLTAYLYFADPGLQPVIFGTLLYGKKPGNLPFMSGQTLQPAVKKSGMVIFADPKFKSRIGSLNEKTILLPEKLVSGQYIFRKQVNFSSKNEYADDIVSFLSTEFRRISFFADFPSENLLQLEFELEADPRSGMNSYSNQNHPRLKAKPLRFPKAEYYFYAEFPKGQTASEGFINVCSAASADFSNDEHVLGCFLRTVLTGEHEAALMVSKFQEYYLFSGVIPTAEQKAYFEKFLKSHGDSYSGNGYLFQNNDGSNVYVRIIGDTANLLIKKEESTAKLPAHIFSLLKPYKPLLGAREFLVSMRLNSDGSYEKMLSGNMVNGRYLFKCNLRPQSVLFTLPKLFSGKDFFFE